MNRLRLLILAATATTTAIVSAGYFWFATQTDTELKTYEAKRRSGDIVIDGLANEAAWNDANVAGPFLLSLSGARAPNRCTARLLWDEDALYVTFTAVDETIVSPHKSRDENLYENDVVEIFLDPEGDGQWYYEFEVSPTGVLFDAMFPSHRKNLPKSRQWNAKGLVAAATIGDERWQAAMKIPFAGLSRTSEHPQVGTRWRMNLYRIDQHEAAKQRTRHGDYTAWTAPLVGDFHTLTRFGTLLFTD